MAQSVEVLLTNVRDLLDELLQEVIKLYRGHKQVFRKRSIKQLLVEFRDLHKEASERLAHPKLSIAMLGTTSSGKSTIVNALVGRRIAPMESGEMSGGVLTLRAADELKLIINDQEPIAGLSDEEVYAQIQDLMLSYHEARKNGEECSAPAVTVYGSLFPANDPELLNLPEGIDFELLDLPGLNSMKEDDSNLTVIREQIGKACNLVALDYSQTDEERRKKLLQELKDIVGYLKGRTDSMIFILNRVDKRGSDDFPIEDRIEKLKVEIQEVLELKEVPEIIPFSARLLYLAQCAWGIGSVNEPSQIDPQMRTNFLDKMFMDCATIIKRNTKHDRKLATSFSKIEQVVNDKGTINDQTMRKILNYAYQWSGGEELWKTLRQRVEESFPQLVIIPALTPVLKTFKSLMAQLDSVAKTRRLKDKEEIKNLRKALEQDCKQLTKKINNDLEETKELLNRISRKLKDGNVEDRRKAIDEANQQDIDFVEIRDISDEVMDLLEKTLVRPVHDALKKKIRYIELRDQLQDFIPFNLADGIAESYDQIKDGLAIVDNDHDRVNRDDQMIFQVRFDDNQKRKILTDLEEGYKKINTYVADAMVLLAEFELQTRTRKFSEVMQEFVKRRCSSLLEDAGAVLKNFHSLELLEALDAEFQRAMASRPPQLPERFLNFDPAIEIDTIQETEQVGTKEVEYAEQKRFLVFFHRNVTRIKSQPIYEDVQYQVLAVPSHDQLRKEWNGGVQDCEQVLWSKLIDWIEEYLGIITSEFKKAVDVIQDLVNDSLEEQLEIIEGNFEESQKMWDKVELQRNASFLVFNNIEKAFAIVDNGEK